MEPEYDVFFSYNTRDRSSVAKIAARLIDEYSLKVWLDDDAIVPGRPISRSISDALRRSRSIAIFVGNENLGKWQTSEVDSAIRIQINNGVAAIPVLLPGATDEILETLPLFLLNNRYIDFREGLENEDEFYNLRWGIAGERPEREQAEALPQSDLPPENDLVDEAISNLVQILRGDNITFFLGPGAAYGADPMPAQASEIARELLAELRIIEANYRELLPPFDVASLYYGVKSGDRLLERTVTNRMADKSRVFPRTYECLAVLLNLLAKRPERRSRSTNLQLVVTTNLDLMAERAFLRAGLSFTRIVQHRTGQQIDVNEYRHVRLLPNNKVEVLNESGEPQEANRDSFDELDRLIATCGTAPLDDSHSRRQARHTSMKFKALTQPILYKFLGSQDIDSSCVISTLHHFEFARGVLQHKGLPEELTSTIRNSTILFLGLWFMDPDFRLTYYTLLRDALKMDNDRRYALQLPPQRFGEDVYRRMERGIWDKIKEAGVRQMGITAIEEPCDTFLEKLYVKVKSELRLDP